MRNILSASLTLTVFAATIAALIRRPEERNDPNVVKVVGTAIGEGLQRGARCTVDLSQVDHLSIAHVPLEQVRERFSIVPLQSAPE